MNDNLFQLLNQFAGRYDWFDDLMTFCAQDIVWIMIAILGFLWITGKENNQKTVFYACLTTVVALLVASLIISPMVNHPRPFVDHQVHQLIAHAPDASFPSDHATFAFSLAFSILFAKRKTGVALLALAVITGIARVFVGVHYPADIGGAILLSFIIGFLVHKMRGKLDFIPLFFIRIYGKLVAKVSFLPRSQ
ncbi:undecaprenyl-diphosphatase [Cohnella endophytica]|uniref:Undecaprenyl-diphosphatase n=1 Tax=Cohnella endophytica TaxID=2419778 RepID=A0A494Y935_9BACL|nr:undecaprenyl-diphosphatase [Cohnella endophytica]RKP58128.1 undecaprenyl-diphosphatase [Cohnella endophytica]